MDTKVAPVQRHGGKSGARCWTSSCVKQLAGNLVIQESRILDGIVQREFFKAMKGLARRSFRKVQRETGVVINRPIAPESALEMKRHIRVNVSALLDRRQSGGALASIPVPSQHAQTLRRRADLDAQYPATGQ